MVLSFPYLVLMWLLCLPHVTRMDAASNPDASPMGKI
nr:MAG TPA: hypothetical protein [Bacteriophage sp.]